MTRIFDAHFDFLSEITSQRNMGNTKVFEKDFYPNLKKGGIKFIVASIYLQDHLLRNPFYHAMEQIGYLHEELRESPELISLIRTKEDLESCLASDKIGIILSFEGTEPLLKPQDLYTFYELGVRLMGLTWSRRNIYADGCDFTEGLKKGGLSKKGFELIDVAKKLGVIIDISHLSDEGLEDLLELDIPLIASHSNAYSLTPTPRNLKDRYLDKLSKKDFFLGVNGAQFIITRDGKSSSPEDYRAHTKYLVNKLGPDKVGFGLDLCDCLNVFSSPNAVPTDVIGDHSQAQELIECLEEEFEPALVEKLALTNLYDFLKKHLP
ncbi:MAG: hypothetical protein GX079_01960 [Tissierellia bacterium]|nr:hypothetical protein [Tissierellia bacterium]